MLPVSCGEVYAAWTQPELVREWFSPSAEMDVPVAELDVRKGGRYRIVMQEKNGDVYSPSGVYEQVLPGRKLVFTWTWEGSDATTRVTVELCELAGDETELTLTHEGFPDNESRSKHEDGWNGCLGRLESLLAR